MAARIGEIMSREDLYAAVWGGQQRPGDRSVDVYVSKLRGKLEAAMPTAALSTPTRALATAFSRSLHKMFTTGLSAVDETPGAGYKAPIAAYQALIRGHERPRRFLGSVPVPEPATRSMRVHARAKRHLEEEQ